MFDEYDEPEYQKDDSSVTVPVEVAISWSSQEVIGAATNQVAAMIHKDIKPMVEKAMAESLNDMVNAAIAGVLNGEVQPTDRFGKPTGDKATIRDLLMRDAETWLMETVDSYGRKASSSYGDKKPRVHWLFERALNGDGDNRRATTLKKLIIKAVKETIGNVEAVVNNEVRKQVREMLGKVR